MRRGRTPARYFGPFGFLYLYEVMSIFQHMTRERMRCRLLRLPVCSSAYVSFILSCAFSVGELEMQSSRTRVVDL